MVDPVPARPRRGMLAVLLLNTALNPVNTTMIAVALVPISVALGAAATELAALLAVMYLATAVGQPVAGSLADRYGPRVVGVTGQLLIAAASAVPLIAPSLPGLIGARGAMGLGLATAYPVAMVALQRHWAPSSVPARALAAITTASMVTAAIGPALGGVLVDVIGWQAVFGVNIPLALLGAVGVHRLVAPAPPRTGPGGRSVDALGIAGFSVMCSCALSTVLLPWRPALSFPLLAIALLSALALLWWELRARFPFIDIRMLAAHRSLSLSLLRLAVLYIGPYVGAFAVTQWTQGVAGATALEAGLTQLPHAAAAIVAILCVHRYRRFHVSHVVASACVIIGGVCLLLLKADTPLWIVAAACMPLGIAQGLGSIAGQTEVVRLSPARALGAVSGLSRTLVSCTAIAVSTTTGILFTTIGMAAGLLWLGCAVCVAGVLLLALACARARA